MPREWGNGGNRCGAVLQKRLAMRGWKALDRQQEDAPNQGPGLMLQGTLETNSISHSLSELLFPTSSLNRTPKVYTKRQNIISYNITTFPWGFFFFFSSISNLGVAFDSDSGTSRLPDFYSDKNHCCFLGSRSC